ncbi:hypothetical protein DL93DRAFT_1086342 [Clavulina sp. PMI_390]|nr:hypothetical protein DL93DRAFT_1086342 [Clavulina sp. PMI_390]
MDTPSLAATFPLRIVALRRSQTQYTSTWSATLSINESLSATCQAIIPPQFPHYCVIHGSLECPCQRSSNVLSISMSLAADQSPRVLVLLGYPRSLAYLTILSPTFIATTRPPLSPASATIKSIQPQCLHSHRCLLPFTTWAASVTTPPSVAPCKVITFGFLSIAPT